MKTLTSLAFASMLAPLGGGGERVGVPPHSAPDTTGCVALREGHVARLPQREGLRADRELPACFDLGARGAPTPPALVGTTRHELVDADAGEALRSTLTPEALSAPRSVDPGAEVGLASFATMHAAARDLLLAEPAMAPNDGVEGVPTVATLASQLDR